AAHQAHRRGAFGGASNGGRARTARRPARHDRGLTLGSIDVDVKDGVAAITTKRRATSREAPEAGFRDRKDGQSIARPNKSPISSALYARPARSDAAEPACGQRVGAQSRSSDNGDRGPHRKDLT